MTAAAPQAAAAKPDEARLIAGLVALALAALLAVFAVAVTHLPPREPVPAVALARLPAQAEAAPVLAAPASALAPADARARNAADPFSTDPLAPARAFAFRGGSLDLSRATECLALAALAEAGDDDQGQRAVIQVVLNRVRHPAFARTVCGVVFQGSERATGCQFSFTCDGSLVRRYGEAAWTAARLRAREALGGRVYDPVGNATHYHTDWVYPWWSPQLGPRAQGDTHLVSRWPGYWGSAAAARIAYRGGEPAIAALVSGAEPGAPPVEVNAEAAAAAKLVPKGSGTSVIVRDPSGRANFVTVDPAKGAAAALASARGLCNGPGTCRVSGWTEASNVPTPLPLPAPARAALQFSYSRDPAGTEIVLYGCDRFAGLARERCIPRAR